MAISTDFPPTLEMSDIYSAYASAFRYPGSDTAVLTAAEYLAAFDPGANKEADSLHESSYVDRDISGLYEELVRYYEHFGLRRHEDAELPDHVSVELEFMHFLCLLEHQADNEEACMSLRRAQSDFIDRHVQRLLIGLKCGRKMYQGTATAIVESCLEFVEQHRLTLTSNADRI